MTHVLILITVFSGEGGVHSQTRFQEFASLEACQRAAASIREAVDRMPGTLGRDVIAQCHALGRNKSR